VHGNTSEPRQTSVITSYTFTDSNVGKLEQEPTESPVVDEKETIAAQQAEETRLLLRQFTTGYLPWLHPLEEAFCSAYVSLQQLDALTVANVRLRHRRSPTPSTTSLRANSHHLSVQSYLVGTSNTLFAHNAHLLPVDVFVDVSTSEFEWRHGTISQAKLQLTALSFPLGTPRWKDYLLFRLQIKLSWKVS